MLASFRAVLLLLRHFLFDYMRVFARMILYQEDSFRGGSSGWLSSVDISTEGERRSDFRHVTKFFSFIGVSFFVCSVVKGLVICFPRINSVDFF